MSSEKTADMFKDKSEEEIMNWMIRYMTPEQIKSCFDEDMPEELEIKEIEKPKRLDVNDLRNFCANKRYVIHKIEGGGDNAKVYFWFYLIKSKKWQYSIESLNNFPQKMGEEADECGSDTNVESNFKNNLIEAYNENSLQDSSKFNENNSDEDQNNIFNKVKEEYEKEKINDDWKDTLLVALDIQKKVPVLSNEKSIFNFSPVLIESVTSSNVNYYYLVNNYGDVKFVEANISIEKFKQDLIEIIDDLKLDINDGERREGARRISEWKEVIKEAANQIYTSDLDRIKEIYNKFPLSNSSKFFMKNLFSENEFGNVNGNVIDLNQVNLSEYVKMKFGTNTAKMFSGKVLSNKFGTQTIALVSK